MRKIFTVSLLLMTIAMFCHLSIRALAAAAG